MTLRVEQGKGHKDRYAMLAPVLLERLRAWWRAGRAEGQLLPGGWLFPGLDPTDALSTRQLNRAIHAAATTAGIDKRVSMHTLRHYLPDRTMSGEDERGGASPCICAPDGAAVALDTRHSCRGSTAR
jgi:integrase